MNSKMLLLSIAVISVGLFAMPSTLSLFAGQHTFINGSNVECMKCHQDVKDSLTAGAAHKGMISCQGCHLVTKIGGIPSGNGTPVDVTTNTTWRFGVNANLSHTKVITIECVVCHTNVSANLTASEEVHRPFYLSAVGITNGITVLEGANEACIACHTRTVMTINWSKPAGYNFNASVNDTGQWTFGNFQVNTTNLTNKSTTGY